MNIEPCYRCHCQPVIERYRASFWQVRCLNHTVLTRIVAGHPMKTQKSAVEVWNHEMVSAAQREADLAAKNESAARVSVEIREASHD